MVTDMLGHMVPVFLMDLTNNEINCAWHSLFYHLAELCQKKKKRKIKIVLL